MSANTFGEILGLVFFLGIIGLPIFIIWMYFVAMKVDVDKDGKRDI